MLICQTIEEHRCQGNCTERASAHERFSAAQDKTREDKRIAVIATLCVRVIINFGDARRLTRLLLPKRSRAMLTSRTMSIRDETAVACRHDSTCIIVG